MDENKRQSLFDELKGKLRITWDKKETNTELMQTIENAEGYMNHLLGAEIDYTAPGINHILFINYCMYMWNGCENEFEEAYQKDITRARAICEVNAIEAEENAGTE